MKPALTLTMFLMLAAPASMAAAQDDDKEDKPRRIVRVGLGAEIVPDHVGAKGTKWAPLVNIDRKREGGTFVFEAPDESFGFTLLRLGSFELGPAAALESARKAKHFPFAIEEVKRTFEVGAFVQSFLGENFRLRGELRKGINGHEGLIGQASADLIARKGDSYVLSIGPRVSWADDKYQQAYFSVSPATSVTSGLATFNAGKGWRGAGAAASAHFEIAPNFGVYTYGRYERLIGDAGRSPLIRNFGSRDQMSAGVALTYAFGL
jgi:outer membrane protein